MLNNRNGGDQVKWLFSRVLLNRGTKEIDVWITRAI
jgi:hypothetical protein